MPPRTRSQKNDPPLGLTEEDAASAEYEDTDKDDALLIPRVEDLPHASIERPSPSTRSSNPRGKGGSVEDSVDRAPTITEGSEKTRALRRIRNQRSRFTTAGTRTCCKCSSPSSRGTKGDGRETQAGVSSGRIAKAVRREKRRWSARW